jgi:electron transport complex protein RnfA
MLSYISLAISCVLVSNVVLTQFLGICPFLGVSKNKKSALGMGLAVMGVTVCSSIITFGLYKLVLSPLDITYMKTVVYILVIAALVQFVEMFIKKFFPSLYEAFGVYLPLITTNCVVLGVCINVINFDYNFLEMLVYSISITAGYMLVLFIFSAIRSQLERADVPKAFKGVPIALIVAACMALAFSAFSGIV